MRLAIIGSRTFSNYALLSAWASIIGNDGYGASQISEIVSGGARGADALGARFARENGIKLTEYIPDWDTHGKRAGFMRNETIIENCDMVLCFWDGVSKGTANSLSIAKRLKKNSVIIYF